MNKDELTILFIDKFNSIYSDVPLKAPSMKASHKELVRRVTSRWFRERFPAGFSYVSDSRGSKPIQGYTCNSYHLSLIA